MSTEIMLKFETTVVSLTNLARYVNDSNIRYAKTLQYREGSVQQCL